MNLDRQARAIANQSETLTDRRAIANQSETLTGRRAKCKPVRNLDTDRCAQANQSGRNLDTLVLDWIFLLHS